MPWSTPKTNWTSSDGVADTDMNRMEENTRILGVYGGPYGITTNSGNAYSVTASPALTSLTDGMQVSVRINADNTGAATINVNGLGARPIWNSKKEDLPASSLLLNVIYTLRFVSGIGPGDSGAFILQGEGGGGASNVTLTGGTLAARTTPSGVTLSKGQPVTKIRGNKVVPFAEATTMRVATTSSEAGTNDVVYNFRLTDSTFIIFYFADDDIIRARVGNFSVGDAVTYGASTNISGTAIRNNGSGSDSLTVLQLSKDRFYVVWTTTVSSTNIYLNMVVVTVTLSSGAISVGSVVQSNRGAITLATLTSDEFLDACIIAPDKVFQLMNFFTGDFSYLYGAVVTISGSTISLGTIAAIETAIGSGSDADAASAATAYACGGKVFVSYAAWETAVWRGVMITPLATTFTVGSKYTINSNSIWVTSAKISIKPLQTENELLILCYNNSGGTVRLATVSIAGEVITPGIAPTTVTNDNRVFGDLVDGQSLNQNGKVFYFVGYSTIDENYGLWRVNYTFASTSSFVVSEMCTWSGSTSEFASNASKEQFCAFTPRELFMIVGGTAQIFTRTITLSPYGPTGVALTNIASGGGGTVYEWVL